MPWFSIMRDILVQYFLTTLETMYAWGWEVEPYYSRLMPFNNKKYPKLIVPISADDKCSCRILRSPYTQLKMDDHEQVKKVLLDYIAQQRKKHYGI
jgi:hypothetical protein